MLYDDAREQRDLLIIDAAKEAALSDWEDMTRVKDPSEVPSGYYGVEAEIWWDNYHWEYDRIVAERGD